MAQQQALDERAADASGQQDMEPMVIKQPAAANLPDGKARGTARVAQLFGYFRKESVYLAHLGWPLILTQCLHFTIGTVAIIFAGHRGKLEMDVVALSTSMLSATAVCVASGLSGYCDTVFAQVYGSHERHKLGAVLQKCLLIIMIAVCPCIAIHVNLLPLLLSVGHDYEIAVLSEQYLLIHIPGTISLFIYIVLSKYVQNQNKEIPIFLIALAANALNAALHAIFFIWLKTEVWGSAIAQCLTYCSLMVFTLIYIIASGLYKDTWDGWSREAFLTWWPLLKLGVYSLFQHCVEFWAFESGVILCGSLGVQILAAQAVTYQFILLLYTVAWGIGLAGGIRVGQHLGANNPKAAKVSALVTLIIAGSTGIIFFILVVSLRHKLPLIFTEEMDVVELVTSLLPIIAVGEVFDYLGGSMNGILRGCGRQAIAAYITVPAYGFVLIAGITLMLKTPLGIKGFWLSVLAALAFQSICGTIFVCRLNWQKEAAKAQKRVEDKEHEEKHHKTVETNNVELEALKPTTNGNSHTDQHQFSQVNKDKSVKQLTKKTILLRILTYGLSIGVLFLAVIIRSFIDISAIAHHHQKTTNASYVNATYILANASLSHTDSYISV